MHAQWLFSLCIEYFLFWTKICISDDDIIWFLFCGWGSDVYYYCLQWNSHILLKAKGKCLFHSMMTVTGRGNISIALIAEAIDYKEFYLKNDYFSVWNTENIWEEMEWVLHVHRHNISSLYTINHKITPNDQIKMSYFVFSRHFLPLVV